MAKSPTLSSPQETQFPEHQGPSKESSHDSLRRRRRQENDPKMGSRASRDLPDHRVDFPIKSSPLNSPPPRHRSARGDLSNTRHSFFDVTTIPLPKSTSQRPIRGVPSCCAHSGAQQQQGQRRALEPGTKGTTEVVKRYPGHEENEVHTECAETDDEDNGWSIVTDETAETAKVNRALEEPTIKELTIKPVNGAAVEQRKRHLKVHPLFAARYGNDPDWDSMVELGYES